MLIRRAAVALLVLGACAPSGVLSPSSGAVPRDAPDADTGITLAENTGPTLVILSLDPAAVGENSAQVALRDPGGKPVPGRIRISLTLDGAAAGSVDLSVADRRGTLRVPRAGRASLAVQMIDGPRAGSTVTFQIDLPVEPAPPAILTQVDEAMNTLRSLRETQTLASGGFEYLFRYEYQAPDRLRYTYVAPDGRLHETRILGAKRFDRDTGGDWATSDLGVESRVPSFGYADRSYRLRVIAHERAGAQELLVLALVRRTSLDIHYRLWVGAQDHLVRRYVMMALGHYMTGSYADFDAPLEIVPP